MVIPAWFLYIGGFSLVLLGVMQIRTRPYEKGDGLAKRLLNLGTAWSLLCITVGGGLLAMALGYWDGPLGAMKPTPPPPPKVWHHQRTP